MTQASQATCRELTLIAEAGGILGSPQFARGMQALRAGAELDAKIGGRTILFRSQLPASGMTLFGEGGFVVGRGALASQGEVARTVLHELYRLNFSAASGGVSAASAAQETRAAFQFAERAFSAYYK